MALEVLGSYSQRSAVKRGENKMGRGVRGVAGEYTYQHPATEEGVEVGKPLILCLRGVVGKKKIKSRNEAKAARSRGHCVP